MRIKKLKYFLLFIATVVLTVTNVCSAEIKLPNETPGFTDACALGFSTEATGLENAEILQKAVDLGGTIIVSKPGEYKVAATIYLGSNTSVIFSKGISLKKVDEQGKFAQLFINRGALTKIYDEHIAIEGLHVVVNGVDNCSDLVLGLRGVLGFSYVKDLKLKDCVVTI